MPCEFATITETNDAAFCQNLGEVLSLVRCANDSILIKNDAKLGAPFIAESAHRDSIQRNVAEPAAEQGQLECGTALWGLLLIILVGGAAL